MDVGSLCHRLKLTKPETSLADSPPMGTAHPVYVWAAIQSFPPEATDGTRSRGHFVTLRYHPDVDIDTRFWFKGRELVVRGVQNVDERKVELRCYCEEVIA